MVTFFEIWVSLKYLLPKPKEKFFSIITIFSFAGISLGVATLIIVMSVMNGFRDELTNKILGINGHLKLQHFNNLKINNNDSLNKILNKNISDIFVNKIIVSQALFSKNSFSTGVFLKGVDGKYFSERKIFGSLVVFWIPFFVSRNSPFTSIFLTPLKFSPNSSKVKESFKKEALTTAGLALSLLKSSCMEYFKKPPSSFLGTHPKIKINEKIGINICLRL